MKALSDKRSGIGGLAAASLLLGLVTTCADPTASEPDEHTADLRASAASDVPPTEDAGREDADGDPRAVVQEGGARRSPGRRSGQSPGRRGKTGRKAPPWPTSIAFEEDARPRYQRVVLVTIDTLRRDHVSFHGYRRRTTPFLDSLAEKGVAFENAVASVSHTAPSHASMLTGLHPVQHGVLENGHSLERNAVDAARVFDRAGFRTGAFVNVGFLQGITGGFEHVACQPSKGALVVDEALSWLRARPVPKRFFLWIHLYDPHYWKKLSERGSTRQIQALHASDELDDDARLAYIVELHGLEERADGSIVLGDADEPGDSPPDVRSRDAFLGLIDSYDGLILYADQQLRRLYGALEAMDLRGPTLWVVTSDHGEGIGSHGFSGHGGRIYQEQIRVPLVFHATDGSLAPRRIEELVQHVDLLPTLAEVVGARIDGLDAELEGGSLWPLLDETEGWRSRPAFSQRRPSAGGDLYALQTPEYKVILHPGGEDEFYDLAADPLERFDSEVPGDARASLRTLLEGRIELYRAKSRGADDVEIPEEWLEELRALGYVE